MKECTEVVIGGIHLIGRNGCSKFRKSTPLLWNLKFKSEFSHSFDVKKYNYIPNIIDRT